MKHHAMESCELKHPYEKKIYWENKVDLDFWFNPVQNKVSFKVRENDSDYRVTKIEVSGSYLACKTIPEEPTKPRFLSEYSYQEQAKAELGFDDKKVNEQKLTIDSRVQALVEERKLIGEKAAAIKTAEDRKKRSAYQFDLNEYKEAHASWSSPVEIKFNKGRGEVELNENNFGPFDSTFTARMWANGPRCMNYLDIYGVRYR